MKKWKKLLAAAVSAVTVCVMTTSAAWAAVDLEAVYPVSTNEIPGWPQGPEISSDTGVVMEAGTGAIVYAKGADEKRYPASITKLMTLLVAVENVELDETVTFTETGVRDVTPDSGNIGMQLGEVMSMEDCLYAMMIYSANEVSAQIAEYVGGTEAEFINMMNRRAQEIGCTNTNFANASGLPDDNQYTTARDMALIFREGLQNKTFRKIIRTRSYVIKPTNLNGEERKLHTHHPMFAKETDLYYKGCLGGKTGMTNAAGHTLVTGVKRDKVTYIAVVMRASELGPACVDSTAMFDYAYQNFQKVKVEGGTLVIPSTMNVDSLTKKRETVNGAEQESYYAGDYLVGTGTPLQNTPPPAVTETEKDAGQQAAQSTEDMTEEEPEPAGEPQGLSMTAKILLGVMAAMAVLLVGLIAALVLKGRKQK